MSMIARRRAASATAPSIRRPELSGPRWTSASLIASSARGSGPPGATMPQMPHTSEPLGGARRDGRGGLGQDRDVQGGRAIGDVLEVVRQLLLPRHLARESQLGEAGDA